MKKPRQNKKKEEIAWQMKQEADTKRKRKFVEEVFFPLLQEYTTSIHQAKQVCKILQNDIMSTFNQGMKNSVSSLKLTDKVEGETDAGANSYRALISAFNEMTIAEAVELIGGMPDAITGGMDVGERDRSLSELEFKDGTMKLKPKPTLEDKAKEAFCNEFRQLADGTWVAYSKRQGEPEDIRAMGNTLEEALINLKAK